MLSKSTIKQERDAFVEKLKSQGISALDMKRLAEESLKDQGMLIKWERKAVQENKATNLALVKNRSAFSMILIIVRQLYAEGIAEDISFDDAAKIVIDEVLLKP